MKVKRKHVYVREDCFEASERDSKVQVQAFRNIVQIEVSAGGVWTEHEMTLSGFAEMLLNAVAADKKRCMGAAGLRS